MDEEARFPQEALDALVANDLHAVHVPEEYGGAGADALATVIVIEEVARVLRVLLPHPRREQAGSLPVILSGSEALKKKYMTPLAKGDAMFSYCLSEPDAGSDAAGMKTRAVRDGDAYVLNGVKRWITNAGESEYYTVMAVTDPAKRSKGISAFVVEKSDEGVSFGAPEKKLGIKAPRPARSTSTTSASPPTHDRRGGHRLRTAMRTLDHTPHHHRRAGPRHRPGRPRLRQGLRQGAQAVRQADRRLPGRPVHARRHGHEDRGRPPADVRRRGQVRARRRPT
ncbi:hypothetical protein GCM10023238_16550 [Streptomyces heliomycini]